VVFSGNASGSIVHISDSMFLQCKVAVFGNNGAIVGNGMPAVCIAVHSCTRSGVVNN